MMRKAERKKKRAEREQKAFPVKALVILLLFAAGLSALYFFVVYRHTVRTVRVEGNTRYTDEEVEAMVLDSALRRNTLYLGMRYPDGITNLPFIERLDVAVRAPDEVMLIVYEKSVAGYIEYLGQFMYFDREGIVVEASKERDPEVPQVLGLSFDYVVMNEPLPVGNDEVFSLVLNITQLLGKYSLRADRIYFDANYRIYLYFEGIEAELGDSSHIDEKLEHLAHILPNLEGKMGVLRMKDFQPTTKNVTFEERKERR